MRRAPPKDHRIVVVAAAGEVKAMAETDNTYPFASLRVLGVLGIVLGICYWT
jgi:hypothetical protein